MTRWQRVYCLLAVALFSCTAAFADIVQGSSGAGWQSWTALTVSTGSGGSYGSGLPYWNNTSYDGNPDNVGNCLTNTGLGACSNWGGDPTDAPGVIPYWGMSSGSADLSFTFSTPGSSDHAALEIEVAGNAGSNQFGYYYTAAPTVLYTLFAGSASAGAIAPFNPTGNYGFWFEGVDSNIYFTNSTLNASGADPSKQHFALFEASPGTGTSPYYLGMEDTNLSAGDKDYNDMIVEVSAVPEPSAILLLVIMLGSVGIGLAGRRLA